MFQTFVPIHPAVLRHPILRYRFKLYSIDTNSGIYLQKRNIMICRSLHINIYRKTYIFIIINHQMTRKERRARAPAGAAAGGVAAEAAAGGGPGAADAHHYSTYRA